MGLFSAFGSWMNDQTFKPAVPTGKMLGSKDDPAADKYLEKLSAI